MGIQLVLIAVCLFILWYYFKNALNYWSRRGVAGPKPWPIVGNYGPILFGKLTEAEFLFKIYHQYPKEKCVGFYKGMTPVLLLRDPSLIKYTFEKNIATFFRRMSDMEDVTDQHLGGKNYELWKIKRRNLSSLFSNSNLDNVLPLLNDCIEKLQTETDEIISTGKEIDIKDKINKFYLDSISIMCLGIAFKDVPEGSELENLIDIIMMVNKNSKLMTIIKNFSSLMWLIKPILRIYKQKLKKIIMNVLKETKVLNQSIDTFAGRVVYLKGKIENVLPSKEIDDNFDEDFIVDNVFAMILSSKALTINTAGAILEITHDQNAQEKAYQEIKQVLEKNNGKVSVKAVFDMTYMHEIQEESMRLSSQTFNLFRSCESEFEFTDLNFSIDRKAKICALSSAILMDPKHFEAAEVFKPERYSVANMRRMKQDGTDLSFGFGPRMCFARRFSKFMVTIVLMMYLQKCKFKPSTLTKHRLDLDEEDYREPKEYKVPKEVPTECWVKIEPRNVGNGNISLHHEN